LQDFEEMMRWWQRFCRHYLFTQP